MQAPDLPTLYDYETHFLRAATAILEGVGINIFSQLEPRDKLTTPRVEVYFSLQPEDDAMSQTPAGEWYYSSQHGRLDFRVITRADDPSNLTNGSLRGKLRVEMLRLRGRWVAPTLPYYHLWRLQAEASKPEVDEKNDEVISHLTYSLSFRIPPESFPAGA